jgi:prolyl-tRNA synthetase
MNLKFKLPSIENNFSDWYNEIVYSADLVDNSPVRGCMVIRPYGYSIWEEIQNELNREFKKIDVQNCAFPLLIPHSFIESEKDHIEGFAPEMAVVTFAGGKELEEKLVVRPTSETIIHTMFSKWIKSWRDLPYKVNQWCSVVRWEKRPRAFIRSTEFWWQEGHTAHSNKEEAMVQVNQAGDIYERLIRECLGIEIIRGKKPSMEKFPGAEETITFEAMMGDGKALQMGTSHLLNQNFCKQFDIKFQNKDGIFEYPWLTSWAVTTRLIGALVMVHGDQKGLVLPPRIAPFQFVLIPIINTKLSQDDIDLIHSHCFDLKNFLEANNFRCIIDSSDNSPGFKFSHWEMKGVPFRIDIGKKDIENKQFNISLRDTGEKVSTSFDSFFSKDFLSSLVDEFQIRLLDKSSKKLNLFSKSVQTLFDIGENQEEPNNYFYYSYWCASYETYDLIKSKQLTVRCIVNENDAPFKTCFTCGEHCGRAFYKVIVAKAY